MSDIRNANNPYDSLAQIGYHSLTFFSDTAASARAEYFSANDDTLIVEVIDYVDSLVQAGTINLPYWDKQDAADLLSVGISMVDSDSVINSLSGPAATAQVKSLLKNYADTATALAEVGKFEEVIAIASSYEDSVSASSSFSVAEKELAFSYISRDKWATAAYVNIIAPELAKKGLRLGLFWKRLACTAILLITVALMSVSLPVAAAPVISATMWGGSFFCITLKDDK